MIWQITDRRLYDSEEDFFQGLLVIGEGVDRILFREKDWSFEKQQDFLERVLKEKPHFQDKLFIHNKVALAQRFKSRGCHSAALSGGPRELWQNLGGYTGEISLSFHKGDDPRAYEGISYGFYSPIFATSCKPGAHPLGLEELAGFCQRAPFQVIALGGINLGNARECFKAGAAGIALRSELVRDPNICIKLREELEEYLW